MKPFFQEIVVNIVAIYIASYLFSGIVISGGFWSIFTAAMFLAVGFRILRPILNIMTLPLNFITFGLFQLLTIAFIVFLITLIYPQMRITEFYFQGTQFFGVIIQPFQVGLFLSYIIISGTIYFINKAVFWLFDL